jgi:hypothetical protein
MKFALLTVVAVLALAALVACGMPGAPQPPSLELPRTVRNLQAIRKGDKVTLTWTTPRETTDHKQIRHLGQTRICRDVEVVAPSRCTETLSTLPAAKTPLAGTLTVTDILPQQLQATHASGFADYAVEVENSYGRTAGLSNHTKVPLAPTLPAPTKLSAEVTTNGVVISWVVPLNEMQVLSPARDRLQYRLRFYRREALKRTAAPVEVSTTAAFASPKLPGPNLNVLDSSAEWEHRYIYWADVETCVLGPDGTIAERVEGDNSPQIEVFVHDVFPPAAPTGLQAISAGTPQQPFIELSWTPNTESDLAGYNVYRHEEDMAAININGQLDRVPAYRDNNVQVGHRYFYSITAVDLRGNESGKSDETSESVAQ